MPYGVRLHVWGEYACFTRPEMKVERVSYDAMTPSAARGILERPLRPVESSKPSTGSRPSAGRSTASTS